MRTQDGFTIIEALVAIAILSTALVTLYGVGANVMLVPAHVTAIDRAILVAQSKIDEISLEPGVLPNRIEGTASGIHWIVSALKLSNNAPWSRQILQDVRLVVSWREGANSRSMVIETRHLGRTAS